MVKTQIIWFRGPIYFENYQDKKRVLTSIQLVCVTRPTRRHLGAIRARLGPVGGALCKFWGFEATMRQHEYELICFRTAFCFVNILPPKIAQKWFCIQNLHMDLSFQEKKTIWKSDTWLPRYLQNKHCTILFETPCTIW